MSECVFCKIVKKEIPADIVKMTKNLVIFKDVNPRADVHLLIVPKKHIQDINQADDNIWIEIKKAAITVAKEKKLKGYRLVHNAGNAAAVPHMHVHFLGDVSVEREV